MNEVQNGVKNGAALDELCKRYKNRGINYNASPEYAKQESREVLTRTIAPGSYRVSGGAEENIEQYKNGEHNGQKYMTDGDFVDYYNNYRDYTPGPNVQFDTTVVLQKIDRERYEKSRRSGISNARSARKDIKEQLKKEATASSRNIGKTVTVKKDGVEKKITKTEDGYIIRAKKNGIVGYTEQKPKSTPAELIKKASDEWVPIKESKKEKCVEGNKTKVPLSIILAIVSITISLMLIVGSSVMLGSAKSEQNRIENEIEALNVTKKLLSEELTEKNREADIETFAKEELGMINQDYVSVKYIKNDKNDGLDIHEDETLDIWFSIIRSIFPFLD